jgi:hypothetical protein
MLHVANGHATTSLIEAAGIQGTTSVWCDPLHDGPVPGGIGDDELLLVRARELAGGDEGSLRETTRELRQWRLVMSAHDTYDELVLWFEHDLFDQLNLIQLLSWIPTCVPAASEVSLICIGSHPNHPRFKGLGELEPAEIAALLGTRQRVQESQYATAARAWKAFREPTPAALASLLTEDTSALPFLAAALTRFMQEYPWTIDGLSRTSRQFLRLAASGPVSLAALFPRMHDGETAFYATDTMVAGLASELSSCTPRLIDLDVAEADDEHPLRARVTLTAAGRRVLAGQDDAIALLGIDRWMGGVRLQPGAMWRWDDDSRHVVSA